MNGRSVALSVLLAGCCLASSVAQAQAWGGNETDPLGGVRLPVVSLAGDGSVLSMGLNPASMALGPGVLGGSFELGDPGDAAGRSGGGLFLSTGGLRAGLGGVHVLGVGAEWSLSSVGCSPANPCRRRGTFAYAFGTPTFAIGVAGRGYQSNESSAISGLASLDAGFVFRPVSWLSFAGAAWALNGPVSGGLSPSTRFGAGVSWRPLNSLQFGLDAVGRPIGAADIRPFELDLSLSARWSVLPGFELVAQGAYGDHGTQLLGGVRGSFGTLAAFLGGLGATRSIGSGGGGLFAFEVLGAKEPTFLPPPKFAAVVDLTKELAGPSPIDRVLGNVPTLDAFTRLASKLKQLEGDRSVGVLVLVLREGLSGLGRAQVEELRDLVDGVRRGGAKVLAYLQGGGDAEYFLATAADRILVTPQTVLLLNGLMSERTYLHNVLEKLGVTAEFVSVGAYKSAPEQFTRTGPSEAAQEAGDALLDDVNGRYFKAIRDARGLDDAAIAKLFDTGVQLPDDLVSARLADGTCTDGRGLEEAIHKFAGGPIELRRVESALEAPRRWGDSPKIALVTLAGTIGDGDSDLDPLSEAAPVARTIASLDRLAKDDSVRAVVLRIDSPGGSVSASERLYAAVKRLAKEKPVVASMGDVAASGGYYVAVAADHVFAEPGTLTGSIGVFAGKADLSPLLDRVGVTTHVTRRGAKADLFTLARAWTPEERDAMQATVDGLYEAFLLRVAEGRRMSRTDVHAVAQGRVWTGSQALEKKLVDGLGGLDAAVAEAAKRAGLSPSDPPVLVGVPGLWSGPVGNPLAGVAALVSSASEQSTAASLLQGRLRALLAGDVTALTSLLASDPALSALVGGEPMVLAVDLPRFH